MVYCKTLLSLLFLLILSSCSGDRPVQKPPADKEGVKKEAAVKLGGEDVVLAVVNGSKISRSDLDLAIRKLAGEEAAGGLDEKTAKKVLESMVMSRAISQLRQKEMSEQDHAEIAGEVAVFQEQLMVRQYLAKHSTPQLVTMEAIQEYYDAHPELFGSGNSRLYEVITTGRPLQATERDELLGKLKDPATREKWQSWVEELVQAGYPMVYRQGRDGDEVLHPALHQAIAALSVGQVSQLIFIKEIPYLVRVTGERIIPAKPLSEVTETIRKALAPQQLKQAIEEAGKEALAGAVVKYKTISAKDKTTAGRHP
ncbi:MAG: hypothetical protein ACD_75C02431G0003 [uncultured bacterium]|nr:MAG: hypothetical protein ACD_75C02431G0003 [uncultured bacterium]